MNLRQTVKANAKKLLGVNYPKAIGYICIVALVMVVLHLLDIFAFQLLNIELVQMPNGIFKYGIDDINLIYAFCMTLISVLVKLILVVPLIFSIINWFVNITDFGTSSTNGLFVAYESKLFLRSIGLSINLFFKGLISFILLPALPLALTVFTYYVAKNSSNLPNMTQLQHTSIYLLPIISAIVTFGVLIVWIAFMQRYAITPILISEKYKFSVHRAVVTSKKYMRGQKKNMLMLKLSFLGWLIPIAIMICILIAVELTYSGPSRANPYYFISFVIAGLTFILLTPYYGISSVIYARYCYEYGERMENGKINVHNGFHNPPAPQNPEPIIEDMQIHTECTTQNQDTLTHNTIEDTVIEPYNESMSPEPMAEPISQPDTSFTFPQVDDIQMQNTPYTGNTYTPEASTTKNANEKEGDN